MKKVSLKNLLLGAGIAVFLWGGALSLTYSQSPLIIRTGNYSAKQIIKRVFLVESKNSKVGIQTDKDEAIPTLIIGTGSVENEIVTSTNKTKEGSSVIWGKNNNAMTATALVIGGTKNTWSGNNVVLIGGTNNNLDGVDTIILSSSGSSIIGENSATISTENVKIEGKNSTAYAGENVKIDDADGVLTFGSNITVEENGVFVFNTSGAITPTTDHTFIVNTKEGVFISNDATESVSWVLLTISGAVRVAGDTGEVNGVMFNKSCNVGRKKFSCSCLRNEDSTIVPLSENPVCEKACNNEACVKVNGQCGDNAGVYPKGVRNSWPVGRKFCKVGASNPQKPTFPTTNNPTRWECPWFAGGDKKSCEASIRSAWVITPETPVTP